MRIGSLMKMSAASASTIVVGLNGALQKRFILPPLVTLVPGNVHRAAQVQVGVGGKGQDVAVTLSCLGYAGGLQLAQFVGVGPEGDQVYEMLVDMLGSEALELTVRQTNSGMRTCTSIVASDTTTELVEPSGTITESEIGELMHKLNIMTKEVDALCFMGSMPPGLQETTYGDIYKTVANSRTLCVIDTMSGLEPLIKVIAQLNLGSTVFKVNASELCKLANVQKSCSESAGVQTIEVVQAIEKFLIKFPSAKDAFKAIAVTDGAHPAYLAELLGTSEIDNNNDNRSFRLHRIPIPSLSGVARKDSMDGISSTLFPIGAGDAVAAGLLAAWKCLTHDNNNQNAGFLPSELQKLLRERNTINNGNKILTSFGFGLACGSASCLEEGNSMVQQTTTGALFQKSEAAVEIMHGVSR